MQLDWLTQYKLWITPVAFVVGGFLIGTLFDKIVLKRIQKLTAKTSWEGDDIILGAIKRTGRYWFFLAGLYGAFHFTPVSEDFLELLEKILLVLVLLSATLVMAKITVGFVNLYTDKNKEVLPPTSIFRNLSRLLVLLLGGLVILQALGISITPILTALGVGGLAVALALQPTLENLFSGLQIIVSKQLRPGDYVKLDSGDAGFVHDISWRNTTIRALGNNMIIVPNSKLASATITNYNQPESSMSILVPVGVSYSSDLQKVEAVTIGVAKKVLKEVEGGDVAFEPFVRYHTFGDSSINFTVILRGLTYVNQYLIKHEFVKRLHERFAKEGIEIPFPQRDVHMKKA